MANFDLSNLALKAVCPNNEILYDDKGLPSIMVKIPKIFQRFHALVTEGYYALRPVVLRQGLDVPDVVSSLHSSC